MTAIPLGKSLASIVSMTMVVDTSITDTVPPV